MHLLSATDRNKYDELYKNPVIFYKRIRWRRKSEPNMENGPTKITKVYNFRGKQITSDGPGRRLSSSSKKVSDIKCGTYLFRITNLFINYFYLILNLFSAL